MTFLQAAFSFLVFIAPMAGTGVWLLLRARRAAANSETGSLPFQPAAEAEPLRFLHRLNLSQRKVLKQQLQLGAALGTMLSWAFAYIFCMPLLGAGAGGPKWFNPSAWIWYTFLSNGIHTVQFLSTMVMLCAITTAAPLRLGYEALFYRTRPIRIGFLFWSKLLPTLVGLLAGAALGMALAFAILVAWKGQVWRNLPTTIPRALGPEDADIAQWYADLLVTSVPAACLSVLTSIGLLFTGTLALATSPLIRSKSTRTLPFLILPFFAVGFGLIQISAFAGERTAHLFRYLFIYMRLGPPPPYVFALVPVALSLAFIALARAFSDRMEV
ncbi:hypothetical protein SAMN05421770_1011094 [Granulicella rosea]|uniref:Uncharacterized protein n=1 Tax=Granulicella rosea TaxID=474952 RepID=A0A239EPP3_9BACT|nr:hypothetical protein [Granulicella rosea]SNS46615.1 hypothetical protein SAMN05421770_1011094 [Granulicella rosea]